MYLPADSPKENEGDWALQVFNVPSAPPPLGVLLQNLISSQQEVLLGCICWVMDDGCEHFTANTWLSWGLGDWARRGSGWGTNNTCHNFHLSIMGSFDP